MPKPRVLLDECLDQRLVRDIKAVHVKTVADMGWNGLTNGKLLEKAQLNFDFFVTSDQNLSFQQNLPKYNITVIVLCPHRNELEYLRKLAPALLKALENPKGRQVVHIR